MMSGIAEIQSRVQAIQSRVAAPPVTARFDAVFQSQLATIEARTNLPPAAPEAATAGSGEFLVSPLAQQASTPSGSTAVTLGMMLGITSNPVFAPRSTTVARSAELEQYLGIHNIEARNGRLDAAELSAVSGGWKGSARLLPPAAAAWEEMRTAAAADGVDLRIVDSYRSWDVQHQAHQAHLRGEKAANVLPPGQSEHGNGLAVDITNGHLVGVGDAEYTWLRTNASRYGWYPISNESWHWEFRGTFI
jgi:D-alanyl-D-alanine carboxypeptidase